MPTFALPRFIETHIERSNHARKLEQVVKDANENIASRRYVESAGGDSIQLRGIPAIGRGVAGCIFHTNPEQHACREPRKLRLASE